MSNESDIDKAKALLRAAGYEIVRNDRIVKVTAQRAVANYLTNTEGYEDYVRRSVVAGLSVEIERTGALVWTQHDEPAVGEIAVRGDGEVIQFQPFTRRIVRAELNVLIPKENKA